MNLLKLIGELIVFIFKLQLFYQIFCFILVSGVIIQAILMYLLNSKLLVFTKIGVLNSYIFTIAGLIFIVLFAWSLTHFICNRTGLDFWNDKDLIEKKEGLEVFK